jgi:PrtD family type I secretion system ABC transporter
MLAGCVSLLLNIALLAPAIYMMQVFDRVFTSNSVETLVMLSIVTLLFLALSYFLDSVRARTLAWAGRSIERALSPFAVRNALELSGPGSADTDALRDIGQLRTFLSGPGVLALFDAPWLPLYLLLIALMHPTLGAIATVGALFLVALGVATDRMTRRRAEEALRRSRATTRLAEKFARNAEVVVGMGMSDAVVSRWSAQHDKLLQAQQQHNHIATALSALARAARQVLQAAMLGIGAWLVVDMQATAGVMIAATILLSRALQPVEHLISGWRSLLDARGAWHRLGERTANTSARNQVALPAPVGRIDVERLSYTFAASKPPVIRNLNFSLRAGESLGIVGASASGKTTLIRLLLGIWRPQTGAVRLDGADIAHWERTALGAHVGYVPQDVELFAGTVAENIARLNANAAAGTSEAIVRAAQLAHAHEMILQLPEGYDTQIGEGGAVLSGGQRQRIALARALFGEPRLVVLDEPNAHLDIAGEAALLAAIADLKARAVTIVMVTHSPALMAPLDKLLLLKNGSLELFGPAPAVLARLGAGSPSRVVAFSSAKNTEALA